MRQKRKLIQKRKLQTINLTNDWKLTMNINKQKVLNFVSTLEAGGRKLSKSFSPKLSSKYLKDRTWKIKQYLNYILMIINQKILQILWTYLNLKKKKKKMKLYTNFTSTAATTEFVRKIPNRKKISNEHFNLCEAEISLDEIIK